MKYIYILTLVLLSLAFGFAVQAQNNQGFKWRPRANSIKSPDAGDNNKVPSKAIIEEEPEIAPKRRSEVVSGSKWKWVKGGNFYFSWGYNKEWYTNSTIHVNQTLPGLGAANYEFVNIEGKDKKGWENLFHIPLTIPQYNYRIGYFFNKEQDLGIEINFDHTKFQVVQGQTAHVRGTVGAQSFDSSFVVNEHNLHYELNNGANFFLFNLVKRFHLSETANQHFKLDYLMKVGVGPVVPHVYNVIWGFQNKQGFQLGGWNTGVETSLRATFFKYFFLDLAQKLDYARYSNLRVFQGRAKQDFLCYEVILSAGINIPHISKVKKPTR